MTKTRKSRKTSKETNRPPTALTAPERKALSRILKKARAFKAFYSRGKKS